MNQVQLIDCWVEFQTMFKLINCPSSTKKPTCEAYEFSMDVPIALLQVMKYIFWGEYF